MKLLTLTITPLIVTTLCATILPVSIANADETTTPSASPSPSQPAEPQPVFTYSATKISAKTWIAITKLSPKLTNFTAVKYSINHTLPKGITFNEKTGVISGTPTATLVSTVYTITATAADGNVIKTTITLTVARHYTIQHPKYQTQYKYKLHYKTISLKGKGHIKNLGLKIEGVRVWKLQKRLHLSTARAQVTSHVKAKVKAFQKKYNRKHKHNKLRTDGVTDLKTWKALGFTSSQWELDAYVTPNKAKPSMTRSQLVETMIKTASKYKGRTYIVGASSTNKYGLDCSGLVLQSLYSIGIQPGKDTPLWHAQEQPEGEWGSRYFWKSKVFPRVSMSNIKRGDLIYYYGRKGGSYSHTIIHVAIYLGNGKVIDSWPGRVAVRSIRSSVHPNVAGAQRVLSTKSAS